MTIERGETRVLDAFRQSYREAFARLEAYATTRVRSDGPRWPRVAANHWHGWVSDARMS